MVDPGGRDVFEVVVAGVGGQLGDGLRQVLAHAEGVADVEVQADRGGVDALGDLEVLVRRLDEEARLGLDQEEDPLVVRMLGQGLQDLDEQVDGLLPRLAGGDRAAGLGRDVRGAQLGAEAEGAPGVVDPDPAVVRVGLDERRIPVGLAGVGDGVHHERVHVREGEPVTLHRREDGALGAFEQAGGPGVGDVGQELEPLVAECRDPCGRLFEGKAEVGVGAEGEAHGALVTRWWRGPVGCRRGGWVTRLTAGPWPRSRSAWRTA